MRERKTIEEVRDEYNQIGDTQQYSLDDGTLVCVLGVGRFEYVGNAFMRFLKPKVYQGFSMVERLCVSDEHMPTRSWYIPLNIWKDVVAGRHTKKYAGKVSVDAELICAAERAVHWNRIYGSGRK